MTSEPAVQPVNAERDHAAAMYAYSALGSLLQLPDLRQMEPERILRVLLEQTYRGIHVCAVMAAIMNGAEQPERPDHYEFFQRYIKDWRTVMMGPEPLLDDPDVLVDMQATDTACRAYLRHVPGGTEVWTEMIPYAEQGYLETRRQGGQMLAGKLAEQESR